MRSMRKALPHLWRQYSAQRFSADRPGCYAYIIVVKAQGNIDLVLDRLDI